MGTAKVSKLLFTILVAMALVPVPAAQARTRGDYVFGGAVHLRLNHEMRKRLAKEGVRLVGLGPVKADRSGLDFPVSSGLLGVKAGNGYLDLEGGFKLVAGGRTVRVEHLTLYTGKQAIHGVVDGRRLMEVATFTKQATRDGFNLDLRLNRFRPGAKFAGLVNHKLGVGRTFAPGRSLGPATASVKFESLAVRSGEIILSLDRAFEYKVNSVEATIGSFGSAKLLGTFPTVISFPLAGGLISPTGTSGILPTHGGFSIARHEGSLDHAISLFEAELILDAHIFTSHAGTIPSLQIPFSGLFARLPYLGPSIQADPGSGEISCRPVPAMSDPQFVKVLNAILGAPKGHPELFTEGETFGTVAFRVQTR